MARELQSHHTNTEMIQSAPQQVDAGSDIALKVKVACSSGCDLRDKAVRIIAQDGGVAKEVMLTGCEEEINETDEFAVRAPTELGEYTWSAVFPTQEEEGVAHEESAAPFSFTVRSHSTSIAVWDVPSPIGFGARYTVKVGVKCSAGCSLAGQEIRIYGPRGKRVATGALGRVPWPGTDALYWAEVELEAPSAEGYYRWRVKFPKAGLDLPHEEASRYFGFTTGKPPEHVVTAEVIAQDGKTPLKNAYVVLLSQSGYPYRGHTDEAGMARLEVPAGKYTLHASKGYGYDPFGATVEITEDATVRAELAVHYERWD
jgi:hypothetical protein